MIVRIVYCQEEIAQHRLRALLASTSMLSRLKFVLSVSFEKTQTEPESFLRFLGMWDAISRSNRGALYSMCQWVST